MEPWKANFSSANALGEVGGFNKLMRPDSLEALLARENIDGIDDPSTNLLAVDLGMKAGAAVFDRSGAVLTVESHELIKNYTIGHVVIEGADRQLFAHWKTAIEEASSSIKLARIVASEWREDFLTKKEKKVTTKAKKAAALIARQILKDSGYKKKKLSSDASEALCIGRYAIRALKWVDTTVPPVVRYANGEIAT
eukprot:CAMPEP_0118691036 /NCGR_PEP_ID=MMETSP0800-20121206/10454_1 /TAXON_ID=210618 ORGANISM="Striatella unipunctata, Strain CCMP2910" /NCGR_SAMPLE_ID=MMETSP0800 /ASSEMBLY_ACC=CAM_ASM_000638 /LENGTH=195 /DNA_ID=CAMNT_0006588765 /DNA_START=8 /DNA_END=595 /DNA_ORIENTATION=-